MYYIILNKQSQEKEFLHKFFSLLHKFLKLFQVFLFIFLFKVTIFYYIYFFIQYMKSFQSKDDFPFLPISFSLLKKPMNCDIIYKKQFKGIYYEFFRYVICRGYNAFICRARISSYKNRSCQG